jgi:hypothetical protein
VDSRLLEVLNEVLIEKGYDVSHPAAGPAASANSTAAKENVYSQAAKQPRGHRAPDAPSRKHTGLPTRAQRWPQPEAGQSQKAAVEWPQV